MNNSRKKIMIVDDSPSMSKVLEMVLLREDYNVVAYDNGSDAVKCAETDSPNLIIMDINMPGLSGIDAARKIKKNKKTNDIPIIMVSGSAQYEEVERALEAGADDYILKPYDIQQLLDIITEKIK